MQKTKWENLKAKIFFFWKGNSSGPLITIDYLDDQSLIFSKPIPKSLFSQLAGWRLSFEGAGQYDMTEWSALLDNDEQVLGLSFKIPKKSGFYFRRDFCLSRT